MVSDSPEVNPLTVTGFATVPPVVPPAVLVGTGAGLPTVVPLVGLVGLGGGDHGLGRDGRGPLDRG